MGIPCDELSGRLRDICRGHTDGGIAVLDRQTRQSYATSLGWELPDEGDDVGFVTNPENCKHRHEQLETTGCGRCGDVDKAIPVYRCDVPGIGKCTLSRIGSKNKAWKDFRCCLSCDQYESPSVEAMPKPILRRGGLASSTRPTRQQPHESEQQQTGTAQPAIVNAGGVSADALCNVYRGASAVLCCGGPSLNYLDTTMLSKRGIIVAAVNQCAATHVRPHVWFSVDSPDRFHDSIWADPGIMCFAKRRYAKHTVHKKIDGKFVDTNRSIRDYPNVWFYEHTAEWKPQEFLTQRLITWGDTRHSVMLPALRILYWLGIRNLAIIGADFHMIPERSYAFNSPKDATAAQTNNNTYTWLNDRFAELRPHFDQVGYNVVNATPSGNLTAFRRVDYAQFIADSAIQTDATVDVTGFYKH